MKGLDLEQLIFLKTSPVIELFQSLSIKKIKLTNA